MKVSRALELCRVIQRWRGPATEPHLGGGGGSTQSPWPHPRKSVRHPSILTHSPGAQSPHTPHPQTDRNLPPAWQGDVDQRLGDTWGPSALPECALNQRVPRLWGICCGGQVFVTWGDILSPEECVTSEPEWKRAGLSERERAPSATAPPCPQAVPSPQQHTHSHTCTLATHRLHVHTIPQTHSSWDTYTRSYTARAHAHSPPCPACPSHGLRSPAVG